MSDPFSVVSGIFGSYTACCEIFRQVQSIRKFNRDSEIQVDLLELQAYRVIFWGEGHGIRQLKNALDISQTLMIEEQKKYLDKVLALFEDARLLFDKYGVQYDKSSLSFGPSKASAIADGNIGTFRSSSKAILKKSMIPLRRLQWGVNAKEELHSKCGNIKNYVDSIYEVWPVARVQPASAVTSTDVTKKLQDFLDNILGSQKPQQLAQLELWLSLDSLRLNPHQDLETYTKRLTPNSCQWIENNIQYHEWQGLRDQKPAASILWINGKPGSGKSLLCASLIQKFRLEASLLAFFFSTKHAQTSGDINFILRFWLQQLAEKNSEIRQLMLDFCSRDGASTRITNDDTWKLFQMILKTQPDLILVVDGVDEYYRVRQEGNNSGQFHGQELFMSELIQTCISHGSNVRLLIVSRPMRFLSSSLPRTSATESDYFFKHYISTADVARDIRLLATDFVTGTLTKFATADQEKLINEMVELS